MPRVTARWEGQPRRQLPSPGPALPSKLTSCPGAPTPLSSHWESMQAPRDRKHLEEAGEGSPTRIPILRILPLAPSAPRLSASKRHAILKACPSTIPLALWPSPGPVSGARLPVGRVSKPEVKSTDSEGLPRWSVAKTPCFQCRGPGFDPWSED